MTSFQTSPKFCILMQKSAFFCITGGESGQSEKSQKTLEKAGFIGKRNGAKGQNRTGDTRIFSPLLYQLSYLGHIRRIVLRNLEKVNLEQDADNPDVSPKRPD